MLDLVLIEIVNEFLLLKHFFLSGHFLEFRRGKLFCVKSSTFCQLLDTCYTLALNKIFLPYLALYLPRQFHESYQMCINKCKYPETKIIYYSNLFSNNELAQYLHQEELQIRSNANKINLKTNKNILMAKVSKQKPNYIKKLNKLMAALIKNE